LTRVVAHCLTLSKYEMIDTKLVLIEGIPGSGKSTTATRVSDLILKSGIQCKCYLEWSEDNPIFIGRMDNLSEIISSSKSREADVLQQWHDFAQTAKQGNTVHIIESRFWQTDAMYLFLSGHSEDDIMTRNQCITSAITALNPVLIFLTPNDIAQHLVITANRKNRTWRESERGGSWEEWGNRIYEQQQWFSHCSRRGSDAFVQFFTEWTSIAERLFEMFPFRKIRIPFNHGNWDVVAITIRQFLNVPTETMV
jgi:thymidylate kinase